MSDGSRTAYIYVRNDFAGVLTEQDDGYRFQYDDSYLNNTAAPPVSLTLPKQAESYYSNTFFPFFDGLIPEGWMLELVVQNWKIDRRDRFGLLLAACRDCIGAVSVRDTRG